MKNNGLYNSLFTLGVLIAQLTIGCKKEPEPALPLAAYLGGRYEWVKTITPTRTITPQTAGYREDMTLSNDNKGSYITYYRNDTLSYQADVATIATQTDNQANSLLYSVGNAKNIKIYLSFGGNKEVKSIATSTLMQPYIENADTVRSYYVLTALEPRKR